MQRIVMALGCIVILAISTVHAEEVTVDAKIKALDPDKRSITIVQKSKGEEKSVELEVSRKAKITVDGNEAALKTLKVGQNVKISYDDKLEIVTAIKVGSSKSLEVLNLDELNTEGMESAPWLSRDGLTIYWSSTGSADSKETWIWTAHRKDADSLFGDKKKLFRGNSSVLTSDGLEMIFRAADSEGFQVATRNKVNDPFGRPRLIPELRFPEQDPAPRSVSLDELTLYFDLKQKGENRWDTWVTTRSDRTGKWMQPKRLDVSLKGKSGDYVFVQAYLTGDGLQLYCVTSLVKTTGQSEVSIGVLSRSEPQGQFTQLQLIDLPGGAGYPVCLAPRYVAATRELFLVSNRFFSDEATAKKRKADLWVIKNFTPPGKPEKQDK